MMQRITFGDGDPKPNSVGFATHLPITPKHVGVPF